MMTAAAHDATCCAWGHYIDFDDDTGSAFLIVPDEEDTTPVHVHGGFLARPPIYCGLLASMFWQLLRELVGGLGRFHSAGTKRAGEGALANTSCVGTAGSWLWW